MKKILKLSLLSLVSFFTLGTTNVVLAAEAGSGPSPFVDCGIGAALFPDTAWAAITSNVIWDVGTTAVTSATASPETCSSKDIAVSQFIGRTYDNLIEETARGEGEHIVAMLDLYGCNSNVRTQIVSNLRSNVSKTISSKGFATQTTYQKAQGFHQEINAVISGQFSKSCSA